jgi:signal peptidase I
LTDTAPPVEIPVEKQPEKPGRRILRTAIWIIGVIVLAFLLRFFVVEAVRVVGNSMQPALEHGDRLLVNRLGRWFGLPGRGSIIVCHFPHNSDTKFIKRLVGLPGDTVEIRHGNLYVNDSLVEEPYKKMERPENRLPIKLGEGEVYVLGDNRDCSGDSRQHGPVPADMVTGRAYLRFWPLSRFGRAR